METVAWVVKCTAKEYEELRVPDPRTIYLITDTTLDFGNWTPDYIREFIREKMKRQLVTGKGEKHADA